MPRQIHAPLDASGRRFAIVAGRFNRPISENLVDGAVECLTRHGCDSEAIDIYYVPGSYEVPQAISRLAKAGGYDGLVALSVLIRGETPHFDFIARTVAGQLSRLGVDSGVPVAFGVITADTIEQAQVRSGIKHSGKGWEAALAAIEMVNLTDTIQSGSRGR